MTEPFDPLSELIGAYDKDGTPLNILTWGALHEQEEYVRIASTHLLQNHIWVSTVWTGLDVLAAHDNRPPRVFETMVFSSLDAIDQACIKYTSEADALAGHAVIVDSLHDFRMLLMAAREIPEGRRRHGMVKLIRDQRRAASVDRG